MIHIDRSVFINRPQNEVYEFVTNPENLPKWNSGVVSVERKSNGPVAVGSEVTQEMKVMGRTFQSDLVVTEHVPPSRFAVKSTGGPVAVEIQEELKPQEGGTELVLHMNGEVGGFFKVAEGMFASQLQKQFEDDLLTLKGLLEKG